VILVKKNAQNRWGDGLTISSQAKVVVMIYVEHAFKFVRSLSAESRIGFGRRANLALCMIE
jgi:hypothetical protein